eukprot:g12599.t1
MPTKIALAFAVSISTTLTPAGGLPIADMCRHDPSMVEVIEGTLHPTVVRLQKKCTEAQSDIFQRVSGHLVKHKLEEFCSIGIAALFGALDILEAVCADYNRMQDRAVRQNGFLRHRVLGEGGTQMISGTRAAGKSTSESFKEQVRSSSSSASDFYYLGFDAVATNVGPSGGRGFSSNAGVSSFVKSGALNNGRKARSFDFEEAETSSLPPRPETVDSTSGAVLPAASRSDSRSFDIGEFLLQDAQRTAAGEDAAPLEYLDVVQGVFESRDELKEKTLRGKVEKIARHLRFWNETTNELLTDFSTGDDWRRPIAENFAAFLDDPDALFPSNPMKLANHLLNFAPYVVEAVLATVKEVVNYHLADFNVRNLPVLLQQIEFFPKLVQPELRNSHFFPRGERYCRALLGFDRRRDPLLAKRRLFTDVTGLFSLQPTLLDHLEFYSEQLSYTVVGMQPRAVIGAEKLQDTYRKDYGREEAVARAELAKKFKISKEDLLCNATGLAYTPSKCLFDAGWGSLTFTINTEDPYDATLTVSEMTEKALLDWRNSDVEVLSRPAPFVQPVSNGSISYDEIIESVDGVYKTLNHPTPDFMFISPLVGNCVMMEKLGRSRDDQKTKRKRNPQLAPKLIAVPINPLIPPPFEFVPDFNKWHDQEMSGETSTSSGGTGTPDDTAWLFVQCSVSSAEKILAKQGYALLQIDHAFALFGRKLGPATRFNDRKPLRAEELWLQGWFCSPAAYTFMALQWKSGLDTDFLIDNSVDSLLREQELCRFADRFSLPLVASEELHGQEEGNQGSSVTKDSCGRVKEQLEAEERGLVALVEGELGLAAEGKHEGRESGAEADASAGSVLSTASPLDPGSKVSLFDDFNILNPAAALRQRKNYFFRDWEIANPVNELGKKYLLESENRGRCLDELGICECFVPYRGRFCEQIQYLKSFHGTNKSDPGRKNGGKKPFKAALHYLVGDSPRLLRDMTVSLQILWRNFNAQHEYPVVIFHDGLPPASRQLLIEASPNPLWFALVHDYTQIPKHLADKLPQSDFAGYPLGYRGMCRFRSGPIFLHPMLKQFDYAWTLDTDGYFPAKIVGDALDPIQRMHTQNKTYMYSHISRDQAGQVQHFWEFTRLYLEHKGISGKKTKLMRRITDALVMRDTYWHEWNRLLFMNDIELVRLSWFQADLYQDYFNFLDALGGFWLYRWGDHGIRTIAIALHLGEEFLDRLDVPYSHQSACVCPEGTKCVKRKDGKKSNDWNLKNAVEEDVSRSFKYECVWLAEGEVVPEEDLHFGVVDPIRFFGGT